MISTHLFPKAPYVEAQAPVKNNGQTGLDNRALKCNIFKAFLVYAVADKAKEGLSVGEGARGFVNRMGR
jgi:hypothetical protein